MFGGQQAVFGDGDPFQVGVLSKRHPCPLSKLTDGAAIGHTDPFGCRLNARRFGELVVDMG